MEPIFTDKELERLIEEYMDREFAIGGSPDEHVIGRLVRDAVEDKFHILVEEDMRRRQTEGMKHVQEIGRLLAKARSED